MPIEDVTDRTDLPEYMQTRKDRIKALVDALMNGREDGEHIAELLTDLSSFFMTVVMMLCKQDPALAKSMTEDLIFAQISKTLDQLIETGEAEGLTRSTYSR